MSVHKRGDGWRVRYLDGDRHRSKAFDLKADAQAFDQEVRRRKQRGTLDVLTAPAQTLDQYVVGTWVPVHTSALASASRTLYAWAYDTHVSPHLGRMAIHTITPAIVSQWQAGLVARDLGHETVSKARSVLSGILRTAVEAELIDRNPVTAVRAPAAPMREEPTVLAPTAVEAIRAACGPAGAALVSVLAYAGLRPHEAWALTWGDVKERTLIASAAKTRRRRSVRLLAPLAADLREWRLASGRPGDDEPVFTLDRNRFDSWRRGEWRPALASAGIDYQRPYVLRHSFASLLLHEGRNVIYVARQLGHSPTMTLTVYGHVMDELEDAPRVSAEDAVRQARATTTNRRTG